MLEKVQSQLEHLSKSEHKVAEVILVSPGNIIHSSIVALALEANVSEPTVGRFCRNMDMRGFPDLKPHLAQGLTNGTSYIDCNVDENDSVESYTEKVFKSTMATFGHTHHSLGKSAINRVVDLFTQAGEIAFFGLDSSATVAHDAMNKLSRFNVPVMCSSDIVLQRMSCMNCSDGDVVALISHTGGTRSLVELMQLAYENDIMVITLTFADTPFAREAALVTTLDVPEDTDIHIPMVSRFAQLTMTDTLATGFTLQRGAKFRDNLRRVKETLKESRSDKQLLNLSGDR